MYVCEVCMLCSPTALLTPPEAKPLEAVSCMCWPCLINPVVKAAWMLDISTISAELKLGLDLADVYHQSDLYK